MSFNDPTHDALEAAYAKALRGGRQNVAEAKHNLRTYTTWLLADFAERRSERRTADVVQLPLPLKRRHSGA